MKYTENQPGWFILFPTIAMMLFIVLAWYNQWGSDPVPLGAMIFVVAMLLLIILLFFRMKIEVDRKEIVVSYGIGAIRRKIPLESITGIRIIRNKWYYGLGIRLIKGGIIYNIHSLDGIELNLESRNSFLRIGTPDPGRLVSEIEKRMRHSKK